MIGKLTGPVHTWEMFDIKRTFGEVTIPFSEAREYIMAVRYNALNGKGQQREIVESHLRKLKAAMEDGSYTPTPASAALSKKHREKLSINDGQFYLEVNSDDPLLQTDAGHRFEALSRIAKELEDQFDDADEEQKEKLARWHQQVLDAPVTITIYFDGDAQKDFINLQLGRPVDAAHMLSLKVQQKMVDDPSFKLAFDVARLLNKQEGSPFHNSIRFDSRGAAALPISTLCSKGSSDIGTSLVGLARIGLAFEKNAAWLAATVVSAYEALQKYDDDNAEEVGILEYGKVLTPLANSGKKGQATMMVGLAVCLAYRMALAGNDTPTKEDLAKLVEAAKATLDVQVAGNFSGPTKRKLLGKFAQVFLADAKDEKHGKLPVTLLKILSASTFGAEPLPKATKPAKKSKKPDLPDVDGPVVTSEPVAVPVPAAEPETQVEEPADESAPWEDEPVAVTDVAPWETELQG